MPRKKKLSENDQKQLLILKSTYEMQLKERENALLRGKKDSVERMNLIIKDTLTQIGKIDSDFAKQCASELSSKGRNKDLTDIINKEDNGSSLYDELEKLDVIEEKFEKINEPTVKEETVGDKSLFYDKINDENVNLYDLADNINDSLESALSQAEEDVKAEESIYNNVDPLAQYDLIPLPSKGECYKLKVDKLPVGYLTASDENLITSPNLYESGSITSILLKKKVLNKNIDIEQLVAGDADAIMVFLRGTSYGNEFPITATDPHTGKKIDTVVDLSKLKYKPFSLKGDENGYFDFLLPRLKKNIKFKFLTKKEEKLLQKINKREGQGIAAYELNNAIEKIKSALQSDNKLSTNDKNIIIDANGKIEKWAKTLKQDNKTVAYSKTVTNTMEMEIVSIEGNTDKSYIHEFVMNMPASDSLAFRRYIYDNEPGVDFEITVQRPESMGGGSFKCFLEWDDTIFWNIA